MPTPYAPLTPDHSYDGQSGRRPHLTELPLSPPHTPTCKPHGLFGEDDDDASNLTRPKAATKPVSEHLVLQILSYMEPTDVGTVRRVSQTSRSLNAVASRAFGAHYNDAHRATLARAITRKRFDFRNRRTQDVLGQIGELTLFGGRWQCSAVSPAAFKQVPPPQLRSVMRLMPRITNLFIGNDNGSTEAFNALIRAGLPVGRLERLTLVDQSFRPILPALMRSAQQAASLRHLMLLNDRFMPGTTHSAFAEALRDHLAPPVHLQFAAFPELETFTWHPVLMPGAILDFAHNANLQHVSIARAHLCSTQSHTPNTVLVRWPNRGLKSLELHRCNFPANYNGLSGPGIKERLYSLTLDVAGAQGCINLTDFENLSNLELLGDYFELERLRMPSCAPLQRLVVHGQHQAGFFARISPQTAGYVQYLTVAACEPAATCPVPFHLMPRLAKLVVRDLSKDGHDTASYFSNLPADLPFHTLKLEGHVRPGMLGKTLLPRLECLDLSANTLPQSWMTVLDGALGRNAAFWPKLRAVCVGKQVQPKKLLWLQHLATGRNVDIHP